MLASLNRELNQKKIIKQHKPDRYNKNMKNKNIPDVTLK